MYDVLDLYVGKLLDKLKEYGILENTMIVFMSDNGGGEPDGQLNDILRGGKFTFLEGGIRVPFIISYPSKIAGNRIYNYPVMNIDILPTILDVAGCKLEKPVDGVSLLPYLKGKKRGEPHHALYWSLGLNPKDDFAIRKGDWKLVSTAAGVGLYNIKDDPAELSDQSKKHPEIVSELKNDFENWDKKSCAQSFSAKILNTWHSAQDSVQKLNRKYHYSSTFGED
jgi:arylsulfatase A-like enzyme